MLSVTNGVPQVFALGVKPPLSNAVSTFGLPMVQHLVVGLLAHVAKYAASVALVSAILNRVARWPNGLPW